MSSMDKYIMNIFLKVLQNGSKHLNREVSEKDPQAKDNKSNIGETKSSTNKAILLKFLFNLINSIF